MSAALCLLAAYASLAAAQTAGVVPDIPLRMIEGRDRTLSELWSRRPLLITFFYARCAGVCSPYLLSLAENTAMLGGAGGDYDILAMSIDPDSGTAAVRDYAEHMGLSGKPGWFVATADPRDVTALARATGYWYRLDDTRGQYDHPALTAAISGGRIVRILQGTPVNYRALRETLWELRGNFVPTYAAPGKNSLLSCFQYDPATGRPRPNWGLLVLVTPALAAIAVTMLIFTRPPRVAPVRPDQAPT